MFKFLARFTALTALTALTAALTMLVLPIEASAGRPRYQVSRVNTSRPAFERLVRGLSPTMDIKPGKSTTKQRLSASFDDANSEHLSIADNTSLSMSDIDFSIAGWLYLDDIASNHTFLGKYTSTGNQREYLLYYDSAGAGFFWAVSYNGTSTTTVQSDVDLTPTVTPSAGVWYFLVLTHEADNNVLRMTIKGSGIDSTGTVATTNGVFDGSAEFNIGSYNAGASAFNDGSIASVGIWKNRAITADEATTLYNNGKPLRYNDLPSDLTTSLESYWDLDESSGTRYDSAGSNDLTDNGTVTSRYSLEGSGVYDSVVGQIDSTIGSVSFTQGTDNAKPLLTEGGRRENRQPFSEGFSGSEWTKDGVIFTTNTLTASSGGTNHRIYPGSSYRASSSGAGEKLRITYILKYVNHPYVGIFDGGGANWDGASINLQTCSFDTGTASYTNSSFQTDGDGRCIASIEYTQADTANTVVPQPCFLETAGKSSCSTWSAVGTEQFELYGVSVQRTSMSPTYIPTNTLPRHGSLTGQRGLYFDGSDDELDSTSTLGDIFGASAKTFIFVNTPYQIASNEMFFSDAPGYFGGYYNSNQSAVYNSDGSTDVAGVTAVVLEPEVLIGYHNGTSLGVSRNGTVNTVSSGATSQTTNVLDFGHRNGALNANLMTNRITTFDKVIPTSTRQRLMKGFKRFYRVN